jgi:peptidoglycan/LPS O-acetylase OafA/YrhL
MGDRLDSIDTLRAIAIFFVVVAHTHPFQNVGAYGNHVFFVLDTIGQFDVPFFFLTAGYFLTGTLDAGDVITSLWGFVRKLGSLYLFGVLSYLAVLVATTTGVALIAGRSVRSALVASLPDGLSPISLLYYGDSIVGPLWFLTALLFSIAFLSVFVALGKTRYLLPVAATAHVLGLLTQNYPAVLDLPFPTRDALFFGFFYVALGFRLGSIDWTPKRTRSRLYLGAVGVLSMLQLLEQYAIGYVLRDGTLAQGVYTTQYAVSTVFLVLAIVAYALSNPKLGSETSLPAVGRHAVGIYLLHVPVYRIFKALNRVSQVLVGIDFKTTVLWQVVMTPLVYVLSLALYRLAARVGLVETGGNHGPWLDRLRARFTSNSESAPATD